MEDLKTNPYFEKYAEKLEHAKKKNPEDFEKKLSQLEEQKRRDKLPLNEDPSSPQTQRKGLDSVMNVELLKEKTSQQITELWSEYHKEKDCVFATMETIEYEPIRTKMQQYPNFIYPLPRGTGYEFFVQRWVGDACHFTPLSSFQKLKENSPSCLTLEHFTDLSQTKGIVLMRGFPDLKIISTHESQLLTLQIKMFYGQQSGLKFNLVRNFNNDPSSFSHLELLFHFEHLKQDTAQKVTDFHHDLNPHFQISKKSSSVAKDGSSVDKE